MAEPSEAGSKERSASEDLLHAALDALADGGPDALEALLAAHPDLAPTVRERLERLRALGLVGGRGAAASSVPERLGGFRLVERLGEGGMGLVWIAEEVALGRRVALKMVRPEQLWFAGARERFQREVAAIARLQHPGIVPVYAAGEEGGVPFFTMELVDGCTLADVIAHLRGRDPRTLDGADLARAVATCTPRRAEQGATSARGETPASWTECCLQVVRQVAEALDCAHGRGIVHRDVKPSNVAITRAGRAMLLDFGLARSGAADRLTRTGSQPGSLPYMSPEQVAGEASLDGRTDVYSLGAVLYELLTLAPAFGGGATTELQARILSGTFERPRARVPSIAWDVETVCLKALAREPARRYAGADELARDLGNLLAHRPIEARRAGALLRAVRWSQRNPKSSAATFAAVPLTLVALGWTAWNQSERRIEAVRLQGLADQQAARAEAETLEVLRLADVRRFQDLLHDEQRLWPSYPDRIEDHERWIARARDLLERIDLHRARVEELRRGGTMEPGVGWRFASTEIQWQHDLLAELVASLETLADPGSGALAMVEGRLRTARELDERCRSGPQARVAWQECARSIADCRECPAYDGLTLSPQIGLLPIGRDSRSGLWEFAHLLSGEPARRGGNGVLRLRPETGLVLVLLPGGRFRMGSVREPGHPDHDRMADPAETPAHEVELDPYFLSKFVMTQAQWLRLLEIDPRSIGHGGSGFIEDPLRPMTGMSWTEAERVAALFGLVLPTEAQWERAARAGTSTPWWTGTSPEALRGAGNLFDVSGAPLMEDREHLPWRDGFARTSPVDEFLPNPFGLHDMSGNVMQWCRDAKADYTVPAGAGDGLRVNPWSNLRIMRGANCQLTAFHARSALRMWQAYTHSTWTLGIRPARRLDP